MLTLRQPRLRADHPATRDYGVCGSHPHDPARLSASLRSLALETHHALRGLDIDEISEHEQEELAELDGRLEELYQQLVSEDLVALASYVASLQREVRRRLI
jgi:hypothetical protein